MGQLGNLKAEYRALLARQDEGPVSMPEAKELGRARDGRKSLRSCSVPRRRHWPHVWRSSRRPWRSLPTGCNFPGTSLERASALWPTKAS